MKDLAHTATITKTGVTTWNSANISLGELVGLTDGSKYCASGSGIASNEFAITLTFSSAIMFTDVIVFVNNNNSGF